MKKYWFGGPRGPSWAFKTPKSHKISIKVGNDRLYLVITLNLRGLSLRWLGIRK